MKKLVLAFILFLFLPLVAWAGDMESDLQTRYGENLASAPVALKLKYLQDTGLSWTQASYQKRLELLEDWTIQEEEDQAAKKIEEKERLIKERQERDAARQADLEEKAKKRAVHDKERQEIEEKKAYEREVREIQRKREETLRLLKQKQKARNN